MKPIALVLLTAALALPAGDPAGFYMWKSAELKSFAKTLSPKIDAAKVASQQIAANGNYLFLMAHREGSGVGEWHEKQADIIVVESGEATFVIGGDLVDGKTTAPGEMRGPSIKGGVDKKIAPGDVITIPPKVAHQMKLAPGKEITYFVVKVTQ